MTHPVDDPIVAYLNDKPILNSEQRECWGSIIDSWCARSSQPLTTEQREAAIDIMVIDVDGAPLRFGAWHAVATVLGLPCGCYRCHPGSSRVDAPDS